MKNIQLSDINIYDIGNEIQIIGNVWSGKGKTFLTLFPQKDTSEISEIDLLPMTLEDWNTFLRQTDLLETEIFSQDPSGITKSIVRKGQRSIDSFVQWAVFKRDNYKCRYCGKSGIPLTVDHIDLWEEGGGTFEDNLISACKPCNKDRGRMQYEDWLNSDIYKRKSANLAPEEKAQNIEVLDTLEDLKKLRVTHIRTR